MRKFIPRHLPRLPLRRKLRRQTQGVVHRSSGRLEKWRLGIELLAIIGAATWAIVHFYYQEFEKPLARPKPITLELKVEDGGVKDGSRALRVTAVVRNVGDHTLYITPVSYELNGLRLYRVKSTGINPGSDTPLNRLAEKAEVKSDGYILRPKLMLSSGTMSNPGTFLYPREEHVDSYIFHLRNDAYDAVHLAVKLSSYDKKLADNLDAQLDHASVLKYNDETKTWEKAQGGEADRIMKKLGPESVRHAHFVSLWNMDGYADRQSIPNCVPPKVLDEENMRQFFKERAIPQENLDRFSRLHPDLLLLIMNTESMDDDERVEWLKIQAPKMTDAQVGRLHQILRNERDRLDALEEKYEEEIRQLFAKELIGGQSNFRDESCD